MSELRTLRRPISSRDSAKAMQEAIVGVIEDLLRAPGKPARKLWGIGYAEYGLLDTEKGVTLRSTCHLNWHDIEVKRLLEGRFGVPASVDSIERCALFAERIWGGAREARTAVILDVEEGVGLAVLDKGDLLSGSRGFAGEIGHIQMVPDGELCLCGGRGCLEAVASTQAIVEQARRAIQRGIRTDLTAKPPEALTAQDVVESAARGDSLCVNIVDSALTYLGAALGIVINLYNPDAVILRGGIFRTHGDKLAEAIRREANVRALREFREGLQWHVSVMDNAPAKGAGARVFEELFEIETPVKT
jgi:predicted NBD/HSP70 family sugar kinase